MRPLEKLRAEFAVNWNTMLIGWLGPGHYPPLVSRDEIDAFATDRLACSASEREQDLVTRLLALDLQSETREALTDHVTSLSGLQPRNDPLELRKWRAALLEEVLAGLGGDPVDSLMALTEFWSNFDFPSDMPHVVQGRGNALDPYEYYQSGNLERSLERHRAWLNEEIRVLREAITN